MPLVTLSAHFDGEKICLDEPYMLRPNVKLMVVVLSEKNDNIRSSRVRLGDLPEIFKSLPSLSKAETSDFANDIHGIPLDRMIHEGYSR